jgi:hypothetical protein
MLAVAPEVRVPITAIWSTAVFTMQPSARPEAGGLVRQGGAAIRERTPCGSCHRMPAVSGGHQSTWFVGRPTPDDRSRWTVKRRRLDPAYLPFLKRRPARTYGPDSSGPN